MRFLVTGTAGFVGFHVARRLLADGHDVTGIDGMTAYYDVSLKEARNAILAREPGYRFHRLMLEDAEALHAAALSADPEIVIHLGAQAGVRYSLEQPRAYIDSNIVGTFNLMEFCRHHPVRHLLAASTSSAYGGNTKMPFTETDRAVHPLTIYAASKVATELIAHSYAHLWHVPTTIFRLFTVYGPWGRPDMALFKFVAAMLAGEPIDIYNNGQMERDFTYIDDAVAAILRLVDEIPAAGVPICAVDTVSPVAPYRLVNVGGGTLVPLMEFIAAIEAAIGIAAKRNYLPMQAGDVPRTRASAELLEMLTNTRPATPIETGVRAFIAWYRDYFKI
ncbi:MAG TPA: NAD-dependent epimerase/dehydratase family protein [Stellaceae bacterium]|jgi:UDP-glucuronate 4-epimerase|nr:NAD-dependent epimerase/dehydratase family protein [Stellaceae bacterium]